MKHSLNKHFLLNYLINLGTKYLNLLNSTWQNSNEYFFSDHCIGLMTPYTLSKWWLIPPFLFLSIMIDIEDEAFPSSHERRKAE